MRTKKEAEMKQLLLLFLLIALVFSCTKDVYKNPTEAEEDKYFDLWVKNPNVFDCNIFLNFDSVGIAYANTHDTIGNYLQTDTIHIRATYQDTIIIKERTVPTDYWRKPSYTLYLPDTTIP
jgi:hypothetical protein